MKLTLIQNKVDELYDFAIEHYPQGDNRPEQLRKFADAAFNSADDKELHERLLYLQSFVHKGMKRFADIRLKATPDSNYTDSDLNDKLQTLTTELHSLIEDMLKGS